MTDSSGEARTPQEGALVEVEAIRTGLRDFSPGIDRDNARTALDSLLARLEVAERERDKAVKRASEMVQAARSEQVRADAAERENERLREELRKIAAGKTALPHEEVARAALAQSDSPED